MARRLIDTGPPGWLDIRSYGRHRCTVGRTPEVMIKILNQDGRGLGSVARHFQYLDRDGELPIETDEGELLKDKGAHAALIKDWDLELDAKRPSTADHKPRGTHAR